MTEREPSELALAEAFRAYAEEASTQVRPAKLARHFATIYPHGRTRLVPWRLGTTVRLGGTVRLAWVLLLLAGLLIAMVGGMLIVGAQPVVPAFSCPPGSHPDKPGPVDQARPPELSTMAFDRRAGQIVAVANNGAPETWTFDVCTNTWTQMHPDREPPALIGRLVYDVDSDLTIGVHYEDWRDPYLIGNVWAYDLEANTWTEHGVAPTDALGFYDPVSGLIVAQTFESTELWDYDVETDTWTPILHANGPEGYWEIAFDTSVDRIVCYGAETWLLDLRTGTWSRSEVETPVLITGYWTVPAIAYDEAAEQTVFFGNARWAAYDASGDHWEVLPRPTMRHSLARWCTTL